MLDCVLHSHLDSAYAPIAAGPPHPEIERSSIPVVNEENAVQPNAVAAAEAELLPSSVQKHADKVLESLCDPSRLRIVQALRATPLTVSELSKVIAKTRAATSQHLKVLRSVDAVTAERHGQFVVYSLSEHINAEVLENVANPFDQLRRTG
jgi:DNA-binding transcriptional ArsR family regulator